MDDYDRAYSEASAYFGGPEPLIERFAAQLPDAGRILDIGVGQGRNSLPLARRGFQLTGIDPFEQAIRSTRQNAARVGVSVELWKGDFRDFVPAEPFDAVLAFGLVQVLDRPSIALLCERLSAWLRPGGLVFLSAWHTGDPRYAHIEQTAERIGVGSYRMGPGSIRTFLGSGGLLELFDGWRPLHHWEGMGPWHRHGDGPQERHGRIELVAVRP